MKREGDSPYLAYKRIQLSKIVTRPLNSLGSFNVTQLARFHTIENVLITKKIIISILTLR